MGQINIRYDNDYENNTDWLQAAYDGFDKKKVTVMYTSA